MLLIAIVLWQFSNGRDMTQKYRNRLIDQIQTEHKSRAIALINRQENRRIPGTQVPARINVEESEAVLEPTRLTYSVAPMPLQTTGVAPRNLRCVDRG